MRFEQMKSHFYSCNEVLGEVFQSGFMAVSEDTLNKLRTLAQGSAQRGLLQLETYINELCEGLIGMKHQVKRDREYERALMQQVCKIRQYLELGMDKVSYDEVKSGMLM